MRVEVDMPHSVMSSRSHTNGRCHHWTVAVMETISMAGAPAEWDDLRMSNSGTTTDPKGGQA